MFHSLIGAEGAAGLIAGMPGPQDGQRGTRGVPKPSNARAVFALYGALLPQTYRQSLIIVLTLNSFKLLFLNVRNGNFSMKHTSPKYIVNLAVPRQEFPVPEITGNSVQAFDFTR
jgi:hypothetical protein